MSFVSALLNARGGTDVVVVGNYSLRVAYCRIDSVWHVITMGLTGRLGHELGVRVASWSGPDDNETPQWIGEALLRLGRGLDASVDVAARLLSKSVPEFFGLQALVPLTSVEVDGGVVVECFGVFAGELAELRAHPERVASMVADLGLVTNARPDWDPRSPLSAKLRGFRDRFGAATEDNVSRLLDRRRDDAVVDVVCSDRFPDMVVGLATVVDTADGPAWQILGVAGPPLTVGLRGRFEPGERQPPTWLTQSWLWWLRALDHAGYLPGRNEPVQKTETLFTRGEDGRRCWILLADDLFDDDAISAIVPLHDDEYDGFVAGNIDSAGLTAAVRAARPSLCAEPDRPTVVTGNARPNQKPVPVHRSLRIKSLELDANDDGDFLALDRDSARSVGLACTGLIDGAHARLQLEGDDGLLVKIEVAAATSHTIDDTGEGTVVTLAVTTEELRRAARALTSGAEARLSLAVQVF